MLAFDRLKCLLLIDRGHLIDEKDPNKRVLLKMRALIVTATVSLTCNASFLEEKAKSSLGRVDKQARDKSNFEKNRPSSDSTSSDSKRLNV